VTEDFGIDGDFLEAGLCAWVAYQTINGLASNVPAVTGSRGPRILGGVFTGKIPI
jgi:anhydro-N-acetylmuramic acid kinase